MSRKKEQKLWDRFKEVTDSRPFMRLWRVENLHCDGMSDVVGINNNGVTFWIESKALDSWPVRAATQPLRAAFEPGQIPFMKEWRRYKGRSFVLLRVVDDWLLLNPKQEKELVDMNRYELINSALALGLFDTVNYLERME